METHLTRLEHAIKNMTPVPWSLGQDPISLDWDQVFYKRELVCKTGYGYFEDDAKGIALLRNVAPLMLEVCKEAAEVERMLSYIGSGYPSKHKLSMALAALKTALSEPERGEPDDGGSPELEKHRGS